MDRIKNTTYSQLALYLIFFSTVIQAVAGYARDASQIFKIILSLACWSSLFLSYMLHSNLSSIMSHKLSILYKMFACVIAWSVINAILFGRVYEGNKLFVLMGNMYAALNIVCFFFITTIVDTIGLKRLLHITVAYTIMSILLLIFNYQVTIESYFLIYPFTYAMLFMPYVKRKYKFYIILGFGLSYFALIGGGRQVILFWGFNILAFLLYKYSNKKITFITSLIIIILPWILFWYSIYTGTSIFETLSNDVTDDNGLNVDTRTFLYEEVFSDLSPQSLLTFLFGKGAIAYYDSSFFSTFHRLGVEIPILQWLLQAGLIYVILFTIISICAVINLYKFGNSKFCIISSILIASYYFNCFVSNLNGCNISIMAFWFLVYLSNNKRMMNIDDKKWRLILRT